MGVCAWPGLPRVGVQRTVPMTAWQCLKDKYLCRKDTGRTECPQVSTQMRATLALTAERLKDGWSGGFVCGRFGHRTPIPWPPSATCC